MCIHTNTYTFPHTTYALIPARQAQRGKGRGGKICQPDIVGGQMVSAVVHTHTYAHAYTLSPSHLTYALIPAIQAQRGKEGAGRTTKYRPAIM
jgi:hypothetical protein